MESEVNELEVLAKSLLDQLEQKNLTLGLAESATGGMAMHTITNIDGASKHFIGGVVCYSAEAKNIMLGVDWALINDFGTVSPEVTEALLNGLKNGGTDVGLAITGVAGHQIEGKPPGFIYIGIGSITCNHIYEQHFKGTRIEIKTQAVKKGFELLLEELEKL